MDSFKGGTGFKAGKYYTYTPGVHHLDIYRMYIVAICTRYHGNVMYMVVVHYRVWLGEIGMAGKDESFSWLRYGQYEQ